MSGSRKTAVRRPRKRAQTVRDSAPASPPPDPPAPAAGAPGSVSGAPESGPRPAPFSLTILTPTYNRAGRLPDLYASLLRQADDRVEWLIVDDGSTDGTAALVARWIDAAGLRIRYLAKDNGGKHTAINAGIQTVASRLTMIVDSDDHLTSDAVGLIERYDETYAHRPGLCGFAFTRVAPDGSSLLGGRLPASEVIGSYVDIRINGGLNGDMAEVFYTDCLRAYPFPVFDDERFIAEDVVLIPMGLAHDLVFVDRPIYVCEYLPGGLTRSGRANAIRAPLGAMERARLLMDDRMRWSIRLKGAALFLAYGRFAGRRWADLVVGSGHPWLSMLAVPAGLFLHWAWRRRYGRQPA